MKFTVAAALGTGVLCAAVISCSSGPAATQINARLPFGVSTYRAYRLPWNPGS